MAAGSMATTASQPRRELELTRALDTYLSGRYDDAVASVAAIEDLGPFRRRFVQETPAWVSGDAGRTTERRAAAAAFLLELTHARLESDWWRFADVVEWTCAQLRTTGKPDAFERAWHAASHALAGRARARVWLLGESPTLAHDRPTRVFPAEAARPKGPPSPRHLMHALERFPDDPRFRLSQIVAWTWGRDSQPARNTGGATVPRRSRRPSLLDAIDALKPLESSPEIAAEVLVHEGFVQGLLGDQEAALRAFDASAGATSESAIAYLAHFGAGRSLEASGRLDEAVRRYQVALGVLPNAESATIALASLQFSSEDREAAQRLLDARAANRAAAPDPGRLIGYGSFLRWDALKAEMRKAIAP
jgi:tetratricopeptide (TPR) repeat protein